MTITADSVRALICDFERSRPRSLQTTLGPSQLSTPCARKIGYQLLGVPEQASSEVNLAAFVGSSLHSRMERVLHKANKDAGTVVWEVELPVEINTGKVAIPCHVDAYHLPTYTAIDWKGVGPSALQKYRRATPENYATQIDLYGLALVLSGRRVDHVGIGYIPRNGELSDIHVETWPWDGERADAAIKRYEAIHAATSAGPAVLPLLPTASDCRFCGWWVPGWPGDPATACQGHPETPANQAGAVPNPTQPERNPT